MAALLTAAVKGLDPLDQLVPVVQELARRHATYGVTHAHYDSGRQVLLWTLDRGLGGRCTAEMKDGWAIVYTVLATTMTNAANEMQALKVI